MNISRKQISTQLFAKLSLSEEENQLLIASSAWPEVWAKITSELYSAKLSERSLGEHTGALREQTQALEKASKSSNRYSFTLAIATFCLVLATIALVAVTCKLIP